MGGPNAFAEVCGCGGGGGGKPCPEDGGGGKYWPETDGMGPVVGGAVKPCRDPERNGCPMVGGNTCSEEGGGSPICAEAERSG